MANTLVYNHLLKAQASLVIDFMPTYATLFYTLFNA